MKDMLLAGIELGGHAGKGVCRSLTPLISEEGSVTWSSQRLTCCPALNGKLNAFAQAKLDSSWELTTASSLRR